MPTATSCGGSERCEVLQTSSLLRSISVASSCAPSCVTATLWIRAPATTIVLTTAFVVVLMTLMRPSSRAVTYINGCDGWNAIPVRIDPVLDCGMLPVKLGCRGSRMLKMSMPWKSESA